MPKRCATLLLPIPNSAVVKMSFAKVLTITDVFSPVPRFLVADNLAFLALFNKTLTAFYFSFRVTFSTEKCV